MRTGERRPSWIIWARWGLGIGIAALSIYLLARKVEWGATLAALRSADYRWVALAVLAIVGTFFTRTRRWQALLWHTRLPARPAMTALLVGQVVNLALPMRSGDVARALWVRSEHGSGATLALGTIALEKLWDLLALLSCGVMLLIWLPLPDWFAESTGGVGLTVAVSLVILGVGLWQQERLMRWAADLLTALSPRWYRLFWPPLQQLTASLSSLRHLRLTARAALWTLLTWGLYVLANQLILTAFGAPSWPAACLLVVTLMAGGTVPVPGRLGIYEGIVVASLALFKFPLDQTLAIGLVLHLVSMATPLVMLIPLLALGNQFRTSVGAEHL